MSSEGSPFSVAVIEIEESAGESWHRPAEGLRGDAPGAVLTFKFLSRVFAFNRFDCCSLRRATGKMNSRSPWGLADPMRVFSENGLTFSSGKTCVVQTVSLRLSASRLRSSHLPRPAGPLSPRARGERLPRTSSPRAPLNRWAAVGRVTPCAPAWGEAPHVSPRRARNAPTGVHGQGGVRCVHRPQPESPEVIGPGLGISRQRCAVK